jgi:broad specificity phosphatase PhoE
MAELILIRHGEADRNREHCFQGRIDVPCNGIGQAQRLARAPRRRSRRPRGANRPSTRSKKLRVAERPR